MKLKHIANDSSNSLFNLQPTSPSDSYPVLNVGNSEVTLVEPSLLQDPSLFLDRSTFRYELGVLNFESLKFIIDNFVLSWNRFKKQDLKWQYNYTTSYLYNRNLIPSLRLKEYTQPTSLTTSEESLIIQKAEELGYSNEDINEESLRYTFVSDNNFNKSLFVRNSQENNFQNKINKIENIYDVSENVLNSWKAIKDYSSREGSQITLDTEITEGSVCPIFFNNNEDTEIFNCFSGYIYFENAVDGELYKESFSINTEETCSSYVHDGLQIIIINPNSPSSLIKVVWDVNLISSAKIVKAKAHKLNN